VHSRERLCHTVFLGGLGGPPSLRIAARIRVV